MSRRFNTYDFSLQQMRRLLGSGDEAALEQLHAHVAATNHHRPAQAQQAILAVVDRAVRSGVPFPELQTETWVHAVAAESLSLHGQEWHLAGATDLEDAFALEDGLWRRYRKLASPETRAFLRGLVEGIPLFGCRPAEDGSAYGAISLDRLRVFEPGLRDLAETVAYRVGRNRDATDLDRNVAGFATGLSAWVTELVAAKRDLFFSFA